MKSKDCTEKEFERVNLGDGRLNQRLIKIGQQILESPQSHINQAYGDWSDTKAAYRFFQNDNVNHQDIIQKQKYLECCQGLRGNIKMKF